MLHAYTIGRIQIVVLDEAKRQVDSKYVELIDCLTARQHRKVNLSQLRERETGSGG